MVQCEGIVSLAMLCSKSCQAEYEKAFAISVDLQSVKRNLPFALDAIKTVTLVIMTTANSILMSAQTQSMTIMLKKSSFLANYGGDRVVRWYWVIFQCPTNFDYSKARAYCVCSRCGRDGLDICTLVYHFSLFSPSLWERPDID